MFGFEHAMAHRELLGAMAPLDRFSVIPYFVHPQTLPSGGWRMDHQQAHNAMAATPSPLLEQILRDSNLFNPEQRKWWEFMNHHEHYIHQ